MNFYDSIKLDGLYIRQALSGKNTSYCFLYVCTLQCCCFITVGCCVDFPLGLFFICVHTLSIHLNCLAVFLITPLFPLLINTQEVLFHTFLRVNPRTLNYVKQNSHAFLQGEIMLSFISGFSPNRATKTSTQIVHKLNFVEANLVDCDSLWL